MAKSRSRAVSKSLSITAPIGGLNARDSLAAMPPQDAVVLDNWFPTPTTVDLRNGFTAWATGFPSPVESLLPYTSSTAAKLFAAAGTAIYDATSNGAIGAGVRTGLTNARWQSVNMGTPGGQFLECVNGADKLRGYDGTNWWTDGDGTHDISGVDTATWIHLNVFKNRLYAVQVNTFKVWYLPVNSISGAATAYDLSPLFKMGGYLMAMATWTVDNSAGIQEYAVFISSEGEVAIYQGYDPSTAGAWSLVGMFHVGRPVGRRCYEKVGADLVLVTSDGAFPLSKAMLTDRSQQQDALSAKIVNLINADVQTYGANFGWDIKLSPLGNKLLINVPEVVDVTSHQYVMNTITGAWCRFTGWPANCFIVLRDQLYFGGPTYVAKADTGYSDNGAFIFGDVLPAFNYFGAPGLLKRWTMVRPTFYTSGAFSPALDMNVDFQQVRPTDTGTFAAESGTAWDTALWDTFAWGSTASIKRDWQGVAAMGSCGALRMRVVNNATSVQWMALDYVYEMGAIV